MIEPEFMNAAEMREAANLLLQERVLRDKPELAGGDADAFGKACLLRSWVSENIPVCMSTDSTPHSPEWLAAKGVAGRIGVLCGGLSRILAHVYSLFGFQACCYTFGFPGSIVTFSGFSDGVDRAGAMSHTVVLCGRTENGGGDEPQNRWIQDPLRNISYVDATGEPVSIKRLYELLAAGRPDAVHESHPDHFQAKRRPHLRGGDADALDEVPIAEGMEGMEQLRRWWDAAWYSSKSARQWRARCGVPDHPLYAFLAFAGAGHRDADNALRYCLEETRLGQSVPTAAFPVWTASGDELARLWETCFYGSPVQPSPDIANGMRIVRPTDRRDHAATPFFTDPTPVCDITRFEIELGFASCPPQNRRWHVELQNETYDTLAEFIVRPDDAERVSKTTYVAGRNPKIRLVFRPLALGGAVCLPSEVKASATGGILLSGVATFRPQDGNDIW